MYDVIVIGAGPGGSATSFFLAESGVRVLLLDKAAFPRDKTCGDGLTPRAIGVLDKMGVLDQVAPQGFRMEAATVYAPAGHPVTTRMPDRGDFPSYMLAIPRLILDDALRRRAIDSGAEFRDGIHVTSLEEDATGVTVMGRNGFQARARTAVIAVGANLRLLLDLGVLPETPPLVLAARTYYEGVKGLSGAFEFHFDGVPLPGYGWIFPLSGDSGNVGAGIMPGKNGGLSARQILDHFLDSPYMRRMLDGARRAGPVKGFPLRTDFARAPTSHGRRVFLVGEAAGLVNPLTGEGVDYALESGHVLADTLLAALPDDTFTPATARAYDRNLRDRFQRLFRFSEIIRDWYLHRPVLNHLVRVANKRDEVRLLFTDIVLGNADARRAIAPRTLAQILFTW
jgi:geranylgeranyl reductase family protein